MQIGLANLAVQAGAYVSPGVARRHRRFALAKAVPSRCRVPRRPDGEGWLETSHVQSPSRERRLLESPGRTLLVMLRPSAWVPSERSGAGFRILTAAATFLLMLFLALPFLAVLLRASPAEVLRHLADERVRDALRLSLVTGLAATVLIVLLGTPTAYVLATRRFPGKRLVETLVDLPLVLPPTVAGFALLMAFGRMGLAGAALRGLGISLPFTTGAVVVAQAFMAAPFFVAAARAGFASVYRGIL
jgi:hypothetical protein